MKWTAAILVAGVLGLYIFLASHEKIVPQPEPHIEASAIHIEGPKPYAPKAVQQSQNENYHPSPTEMTEELEALARKSNLFSQLPESDRQWVIESAANSYLAGNVVYADLVQHIEELSSVRQFAVLERTEAYVTAPEDWSNQAPEGAGL